MSVNTFPRELGDIEWAYYSKSFPNLQRHHVKVLGPSSKTFNCFPWSMGYEDRWIDAGTKEQMAVMYAGYHYIGCDTASAALDIYAVDQEPRHAAKVENATTCSSKMQAQAKLQHYRMELEDSKLNAQYGMIYGHFKKDPSWPGQNHPSMPKADHPNNHELPPVLPVGHPGGNPLITPIHPQPASTLSTPPAATHPAAPATPHPAAPAATHPAPAATHPAPAATHPAPAATHQAPAATHPAPAATHPAPPATHPAPSSHPSSGHPPVSRRVVSQMRPFDPIPPPAEASLSTVHQLHTSLSKSYDPAVTKFESLYAAWKATWFSPEMEFEANSSARAKGPAFDALVKLGPAIIPLVVHKLAGPDDFFAVQLYNALEKDAGVKVDPSNIFDHNVLQRHANLIVDMNHDRNEAFAANVAQWQDHQDKNSLSANSKDYVSGDAYKALVNMGPGVIGHVMDRYEREQDGWWHELLHEIVHGKPSGQGTFYKKRLFDDWKGWFESGKAHDEAPKSE